VHCPRRHVAYFSRRFHAGGAMNPCLVADTLTMLPRVPLLALNYSAVTVSKMSGRCRRIDIHIDVPAVNYKELRSGSEPESSAKIREPCNYVPVNFS